MTNSFDPKSIGARIRRARQNAGLSIKNLAGLVHVSPSYISDVERGAKTPSLPVVTAICDALRISLDWLVSGVDPSRECLDVRNLLRNPETRLEYAGQPLDEIDKEHLASLIDSAFAFRHRASAVSPAQAGAVAESRKDYISAPDELAALLSRAVREALKEWGEDLPRP